MSTYRHATLLAGALLVAGALVAPAASANGDHGSSVHIVLEAGEGDDCPDGSYCFDVTSGDLSKVTAGTDVQLTLENPSDNSLQHNAHVTRLAEADKGGDTAGSAAYASTEDVSKGSSATINFTVPDNADITYIWCDIGAHEAGGMWITAGGGGGGNGGDGGGNGSPGFTAVGALLGVGVALLASRRRD